MITALCSFLNDPSESAEDTHRESGVSAPPSTPKKPLDLSARDIQESRQQTIRNRQENPDDFLDFTNNNWDYKKKVAHHHRIGAFVESPYRNDPRLRDILIYLLENGYGIDNWAGAVGFLRHDSFMTRVALKGMRESGMSQEQIDQALNDPNPEAGSPLWFRQKELEKKQSRLKRLALQSGISDQEVLEGLLEFGPNFYEFGFETPLKGDTVATARQGDRLYTDDDRLTPDLLAAKESYQGKPRPSRWNEQKTILAIGEPDEIVDVFDENGRIVGKEHRWTK